MGSGKGHNKRLKTVKTSNYPGLDNIVKTLEGKDLSPDAHMMSAKFFDNKHYIRDDEDKESLINQYLGVDKLSKGKAIKEAEFIMTELFRDVISKCDFIIVNRLGLSELRLDINDEMIKLFKEINVDDLKMDIIMDQGDLVINGVNSNMYYQGKKIKNTIPLYIKTSSHEINYLQNTSSNKIYRVGEEDQIFNSVLLDKDHLKREQIAARFGRVLLGI